MRPDSPPLALSSLPKTAVRRKAALASVLRAVPRAPFLMILPSFILTAVIIGYPLLVLIWTSFHRVSHFGIVLSLNGIENYVSVLSDPLFLSSLWRTVIWTVAVTGGTVLASVPLALMLNDDFLGRDLARAVVLMPWSVSLTMTAVVWRWALNGRAGLFNATLMDFGILHQPIEWLGTASRAFPIEILIGIAVSIPFTTIVLLGGLSSVAPSLYEAARIDGASRWQLLRHITLPLMRPFLNIAVVLNVIYVFNSFPIIWVMTEGGPANGTDILVTYLYKLAFRFGQLGKASVISLMMFIILLAVTTLYVVLQSRKAEPEAGGTA